MEEGRGVWCSQELRVFGLICWVDGPGCWGLQKGPGGSKGCWWEAGVKIEGGCAEGSGLKLVGDGGVEAVFRGGFIGEWGLGGW